MGRKRNRKYTDFMIRSIISMYKIKEMASENSRYKVCFSEHFTYYNIDRKI